MGTRPRRPRDSELLHRTVRELVAISAIAEPDVWPHYVKSPALPGQGAGWYWTPKGGEPEPLGHNAYNAYVQLLTLRAPAA